VTLPEACVLVVTVCEAPPALAVIVTDAALVVCQLSVTLCPLLIEVLFAEKVSVGEPGPPGFVIAPDPQPVKMVKTKIAANRKLKRRMVHEFIP
jgi:hypothetical protein